MYTHLSIYQSVLVFQAPKTLQAPNVLQALVMRALTWESSCIMAITLENLFVQDYISALLDVM